MSSIGAAASPGCSHAAALARPNTTSPDGRLTVDLQLKRQYKIQKETLREIFDEYDSRPRPWPPAPNAPGWSRTRMHICARSFPAGAMLSCRTSSHHPGGQDELIRPTRSRSWSSRAWPAAARNGHGLHRVAYLLYPGNQLRHRTRSAASSLAPTSCSWATSPTCSPGLGGAGRYPQTHASTCGRWTAGHWRAGPPSIAPWQRCWTRPARLRQTPPQQTISRKASRMGQVLDRLADWWRGRLNVPAAGLAFRVWPVQGGRPRRAARVRSELQQSLRELPVMRQRQRLAELLRTELLGSYAMPSSARPPSGSTAGRSCAPPPAAAGPGRAAGRDTRPTPRARSDLDLEKSQGARAVKRGAEGLRALAAYFERKGQAAILRTRASARKRQQRQAQRAWSARRCARPWRRN